MNEQSVHSRKPTGLKDRFGKDLYVGDFARVLVPVHNEHMWPDDALVTIEPTTERSRKQGLVYAINNGKGDLILAKNLQKTT